jgi:beta-lactamase class A
MRKQSNGASNFDYSCQNTSAMRFLYLLLIIGLLACSNNNQTVVLQPVETPKQATASALPATTTTVPATQVVSNPAPEVSSQPAPAQVNAAGCSIIPTPIRFAKPPVIPKGITGRVGLFVGRFTRGTKEFRLEQATWQNPQGQFPLASNFKTSVLFEMLRGVDSGSIKTTERFNVTRGNQSYGIYPYDNTALLELGKAMISWSDNTATDILFRRVGLDGLQPTAQRLGLCNTRLLLPTKTWWTAQAGLGGADFPKYSLVAASKRFANASYDTQLALAERLDQKAQGISAETLRRYLDQGYFAGRNGGVETMSQIDRNLQNASTPQEWARFMWNAFVSYDLSTIGQKRFRGIMATGKGRVYLRVPFKYYGGKSGNTARILTYSGFLETLSGDKIIYVYMNDSSQNLITRDETDKAFNYINAALKKVIRPSDLIRPKPIVKLEKPK